MCEANCPNNELKRLITKVDQIVSFMRFGRDKSEISQELIADGLNVLNQRLDWVIKQLKAAGEGEKCYDIYKLNNE